MKSILIGLVLLTSPLAYSANEEISAPLVKNTDNAWSVEGHLNTISNSQSSTFGPSIGFDLTPQNTIGFRFFAPFSNSISSGGTTSLIAFYRYKYRETKTSLFNEISLAQNFYMLATDNLDTSVKAPSVGTNIGIIHQLNPDIAFGGIAGAEWTKTHVTSTYIVDRKDGVRVYARMGVFGNISF